MDRKQRLAHLLKTYPSDFGPLLAKYEEVCQRAGVKAQEFRTDDTLYDDSFLTVSGIQISIRKATDVVIEGNAELKAEAATAMRPPPAKRRARYTRTEQVEFDEEEDEEDDGDFEAGDEEDEEIEESAESEDDDPGAKNRVCQCGSRSFVELYASGSDMGERCAWKLPSGLERDSTFLINVGLPHYSGDGMQIIFCTKCGRLFGFDAKRTARCIKDIENEYRDLD